jgi:multiple sugar transport system permease protein
MATATAVSKAPLAGDGRKRKKNSLSDGQGRLAWMLLAPTLLVIIVVAGIPVLLSIRESFFTGNSGVDPNTGLIASGETFSGLKNFTNIFAGNNDVTGSYGTMDRFWNAFLNTTFFTIVCVILETVLGVAMALIMSKAFRGRGIVRAGILVPWAIPTIVSALMWKLIFDESGVMNRILQTQVLWLADGASSFWAIVIADVWKTAPFIGLLTLAGLQTIPAEVYEAAKVDGAGHVRTFLSVTVPLLREMTTLVVILTLSGAFLVFNEVMVMTAGGPSNSSQVLNTWLYHNAFLTDDMGYAAAIGTVIFVITFSISAAQIVFTRRRRVQW